MAPFLWKRKVPHHRHGYIPRRHLRARLKRNLQNHCLLPGTLVNNPILNRSKEVVEYWSKSLIFSEEPQIQAVAKGVDKGKVAEEVAVVAALEAVAEVAVAAGDHRW
jgi:hypothetical protein